MPLILGGIVMWSGAVINIPEGWALCDGQNGTIDLRNRFVLGAGSTFTVGDTGGFADATVVAHNHSFTINDGGNHSHTYFVHISGTNQNPGNIGSVERAPTGQQFGTSAAGSHSHSVSVNSTGTSAITNANLPPYYALAFIQQVV